MGDIFQKPCQNKDADGKPCGAPIWFRHEGFKEDGSKKWKAYGDPLCQTFHQCPNYGTKKLPGAKKPIQQSLPKSKYSIDDIMEYLQDYDRRFKAFVNEVMSELKKEGG